MKRALICFLMLLFVFSSCLSVSAASTEELLLDEGPEINDYDFAMVFIPDFQVVTNWYPDNLHYIFDWIVDNAESKNIQYVIGLGDMTERSSYGEWWDVEDQVDRLNGVVPYALVRGNHDKTLDLNKFFPKDETPHIEGTYDCWINNSWRTVNMGGYDYLIMTLDYGADDDILAWASGVIEEHPDHNVIIATHSYLFQDGTTLDAGDDCPPSLSGGYNDGDDMWEKLMKKHANITLVISGHDHSDRIVYRQDKGDHGNTVTQMLFDIQNRDLTTEGGVGAIAIAYFSDGGRKVQIEFYSTILSKWFMEENQFSLEMYVVPTSYNPPVTEEESSAFDWTTANIAIISGAFLIVLFVGFILLILNDKKRINA